MNWTPSPGVLPEFSKGGAKRAVSTCQVRVGVLGLPWVGQDLFPESPRVACPVAGVCLRGAADGDGNQLHVSVARD